MAKSIAIVEDDPDQRANYRDAITKKGFSVTAYASRQEALVGFERELPDLVILDTILGDEVGAGFQLCRDLLVRAPSLPWDYLPKPISLDYLAERISSRLRISSLLRINEVQSEYGYGYRWSPE